MLPFLEMLNDERKSQREGKKGSSELALVESQRGHIENVPDRKNVSDGNSKSLWSFSNGNESCDAEARDSIEGSRPCWSREREVYKREVREDVQECCEQREVHKVRQDKRSCDSSQERRPLRQQGGKSRSSVQPLPHEHNEKEVVGCKKGRNRTSEIKRTSRMGTLLLTDPPYGIDADNQKRILSRGKLAAARDYGSSAWDKATISMETMNLLVGLTDAAIVWGGNYYNFPSSSCWLVWDKENGTNDFADCELAWTNLPRAVRKFKYRWNGMLQERMGDDKEHRVHPTQKPLPLMRWCLSLVPDAESVLDPFMGSGTTLVAAKLEGRRCVGIEINEAYCEAAAKRLSQGTLF